MSELNVDAAAKTTEFLTEIALKNRKPELPHKGVCYNCNEPTTGCYCDEDCREDHQKRQNLRLRN